jgi:hypothetical protein
MGHRNRWVGRSRPLDEIVLQTGESSCGYAAMTI